MLIQVWDECDNGDSQTLSHILMKYFISIAFQDSSYLSISHSSPFCDSAFTDVVQFQNPQYKLYDSIRLSSFCLPDYQIDC